MNKLCSVFAVTFVLFAPPAVAAPTCDRAGCGFAACATPAAPAPADRWGGLKPLDASIPDCTALTGPAFCRDSTRFRETADPLSAFPFFFSLDAENGYLFVALLNGMQVWDARSFPPQPKSELGPDAFPVTNQDGTLRLVDADAPAGVDDEVAVAGYGGTGLAIVDVADKEHPKVLYQSYKKDGGQVYAATLGGRRYAFLATQSPGGLLVFDMTQAKLYDRCSEATPAPGETTRCPGVFLGQIGSRSFVSSVDGVDQYVVLSSGRSSGGGAEIWDVSDPAHAELKLSVASSATVNGVALWKQGSSYYLGARLVLGTSHYMSIFDVSCITSACSASPLAISFRAMTSGTGLGTSEFLDFSRSDGVPFLYLGSDDSCSAGSQREWLLDVSDPANPVDISPPGYWNWYYRGEPTGFNDVAPRSGKFVGPVFYRAAVSLFDFHQRTGLAGGTGAAIDVDGPDEGPPGEALSFTAEPVGCSPGTSGWTWSVTGDGTIVSPAADGRTISVKWTALGSRGVSASHAACGTAVGLKSVLVTTRGPLHAVLDSQDSAKSGETVAFDASASSGEPSLYSWDFGDGSAGTGKVVSHSYGQPGTYTVRLTLSRSGSGPGCAAGTCTAAAQQTVSVTAIPVCYRGGCGDVSCGTPLTPAPSDRWGGLRPLDAKIPACTAYRFDLCGDSTASFGDPALPSFMAVDTENGYLFVALADGLQVWDAGAFPPQPKSQLRGVGKWRDIDAPAGVDDEVALAGESGLLVADLTDKTSPQILYQSGDKNGTQVYTATLGGRRYAFLAAPSGEPAPPPAYAPFGGVFVFDLTQAKLHPHCSEAVPATGETTHCPGVYLGTLGWRQSVSFVDGVDQFLATSTGESGEIEIWDVTIPTSPQLKLTGLAPGGSQGIAMWKQGGAYYLAARSAGSLSIYDVSCIVGRCVLAAPVFSGGFPGGGPLDFSLSDGVPFLYLGSDDACSGGAQREWVLDVSHPAAPVDISPFNYWGWYYRGGPTGFNGVAPRSGKFVGSVLYRAAQSVFDLHQRTGLAAGGGAAIDIAGPEAGTVGDTLTYTAQGTHCTSAGDWAWSATGGTVTGNGSTVTVKWSSLGNDTLTVRSPHCGLALGLKSVLISQTPVVPPPPSAAFTTSASCDADHCRADEGVAVTFTAEETAAAAYAWDFGDGTIAASAAPTHAWSRPGDYTVSLTVSNGKAAATQTRHFQVLPVPKTVLVPWIAQTRGALVQSTDLSVYNPGDSPMEVSFELRKRGLPETNPPRQSRTIAPRATLFFADLLKELFQRDNLSGFVTVTSASGASAPVVTSFNTTFQGSSRFGQTVPGVKLGGAAPAVQQLVGLDDDAERLAYFGITNPNLAAAQFRLRFFDAAGHEIGHPATLTVAAFGQRQLQTEEIRGSFGVSGSDYRVQVETLAGGPLYAYGSNLRRATGDPSFLEPAAAQSGRSYLLGALSTPSLFGSPLRTDAVLANLGDQPLHAQLTFTRLGAAAQPTPPLALTLQPGETRRLKDVVNGQWGIHDAAGVLTLTSAEPLGAALPVFQGESFDDANPARRFGQSMAARGDTDAAAPGQAQILAGLRQDPSYRTVLWLFNPSDQATVCDLLYRALDGSILGRLDGVTLGPGKARQLGPNQHPLPKAGVQGGFTVQAQVKSGKLLAAAQVVNNATNDPAYVRGETR